MRKTRFVAMAMLYVCFAGCSLIKSAGRTLFVEPLAFPANKDSHWTQQRDRQRAEAAWAAEMAANPDLCCSIEYKRGFEDGFADYLYAGGTGEPPPVPPRRLWNLDYRTLEGHKCVEDWFAGFRQGARAVREAGYRDIVTVKSSLPTCNHLDAPSMPSGILDDVEPIEVIPTPQPTEPVLEPRDPALSSHEPSLTTKKLVQDHGDLEPLLSMSGALNRDAADPKLKPLKPRKPALSSHELWSNTKKLVQDHGDLEPLRTTSRPLNREAGPELQPLPPVDDAESLMQASELRALKPKLKAKERLSTSPATEDKEDSGVIVLPPPPSALLLESRGYVSQLR